MWGVFDTAVTRFFDHHGIFYRKVLGEEATSCHQVAKARGLGRIQEVGKTIVWQPERPKLGVKQLFVMLLCGDRMVSRDKIKQLTGISKIREVRSEQLEAWGVPVGALAPPLFSEFPHAAPILFFVDHRLLNQSIVDVSSGNHQLGLHLDRHALIGMIDVLGMRIEDISVRSALPDHYPLATILGEEEKLCHIEALLLLAAIEGDGQFCSPEDAFFEDLRRRMGMTRQQWDALQQKVDKTDLDHRTERLRALLARAGNGPGDQSSWLLTDMTLLAMADGQYTEREHAHIVHAAHLLGLPPARAQQLVAMASYWATNDDAYLKSVDPALYRQFNG